MAKIAVNGETEKPPEAHVLSKGDGWAIAEVVCTSGPHTKPFEEQHARPSVAVVLAGSFQYRSHTGGELLTPGSLLLGNSGDCFCCSHEHSTGDRCISFTFSPDFFDQAVEIPKNRFRVPRIPPLRETARLIAKAAAFGATSSGASGDELCVEAAALAAQLSQGHDPRRDPVSASSMARVTRVIRAIDNEPQSEHKLTTLAQIARLSPYHLLRVFEGITGATPHQYVLRARLRRAAVRVKTGRENIVDVALDSGFGDVSNFNRAFRAEFGVSPRRYRAG